VGLSAATISRIEAGLIGRMALDDLSAVTSTLGGRFELDVWWRGAAIDRLLDHSHAALVEATVLWLVGAGWIADVEVSFSFHGERGSIDVLGRRPASQAMLVVEAKTAIGNANETLIGIDRKRRLSPQIARERGWPCSTVGSVLVLPDGTTARAQVRRLGNTFRSALPDGKAEVRAWLLRPVEAAPRGIVFLQVPNMQHVQGARRTGR
jgi:hypothetical protein